MTKTKGVSPLTDKTEQTVILKPQQTQRLSNLIRNANEVRNLAEAAAQSGQAYVQGIADERGIENYLDINLDAEKNLLTFFFRPSEQPQKEPTD